jgi:hypothetical protein
MSLTRVEKERLSDTRLKLKSAADSLKQVDSQKVPGYAAIEECLEGAEKSLGSALNTSKPT